LLPAVDTIVAMLRICLTPTGRLPADALPVSGQAARDYDGLDISISRLGREQLVTVAASVRKIRERYPGISYMVSSLPAQLVISLADAGVFAGIRRLTLNRCLITHGMLQTLAPLIATLDVFRFRPAEAELPTFPMKAGSELSVCAFRGALLPDEPWWGAAAVVEIDEAPSLISVSVRAAHALRRLRVREAPLLEELHTTAPNVSLCNVYSLTQLELLEPVASLSISGAHDLERVELRRGWADAPFISCTRTSIVELPPLQGRICRRFLTGFAPPPDVCVDPAEFAAEMRSFPGRLGAWHVSLGVARDAPACVAAMERRVAACRRALRRGSMLVLILAGRRSRRQRRGKPTLPPELWELLTDEYFRFV
jgi:hypothetical protein